MLQTIERYMKQAIVDKNPGISSAALVSCLHLCKNTSATDIVKRSLNEIQEALNSDKYIDFSLLYFYFIYLLNKSFYYLQCNGSIPCIRIIVSHSENRSFSCHKVSG